MGLHDPQRIGITDAVSPGFDSGVTDAHQELKIGAGGIFGGGAHVQAQAAGVAHMFSHDLNGLRGGAFGLGFQMDLRGSIEHGNPVRADRFGGLDPAAGAQRVGHDLGVQV